MADIEKLTISELQTLYPKLPSGRLKNLAGRTLAAKQHSAALGALRSALNKFISNRLGWSGIADFQVEQDHLIIHRKQD